MNTKIVRILIKYTLTVHPELDKGSSLSYSISLSPSSLQLFLTLYNLIFFNAKNYIFFILFSIFSIDKIFSIKI
jgi:hypothetical protein